MSGRPVRRATLRVPHSILDRTSTSCLCRKCKVLSSNPSTAKNKKIKKKNSIPYIRALVCLLGDLSLARLPDLSKAFFFFLEYFLVKWEKNRLQAYFPGWIGDSRMISGTHLFVLSVGRQVWSHWQWWQLQQEMTPNFLSVMWHGEAFHGLGV
jgi:hypothetical protein